MTIRMRRLWTPVLFCLAVSCLIEIPLGMTDIFGEDVILWDTLFRAICAVPGLRYFYKEDAVFRGERELNLAFGAKLSAVGAILSVLFRLLFMIVGVPGYEEASKTLFTGNLSLQLLVLLVASPLLEEFFFRGVLYGRLKELVSVRNAMVLSALFFGLYHGNISQGIYGFFMGLLLSWAMERCRTVAAPLIVHIAANAAALFLEVVILF